jgi:hypothetical protein
MDNGYEKRCRTDCFVATNIKEKISCGEVSVTDVSRIGLLNVEGQMEACMYMGLDETVEPETVVTVEGDNFFNIMGFLTAWEAGEMEKATESIKDAMNHQYPAPVVEKKRPDTSLHLAELEHSLITKDLLNNTVVLLDPHISSVKRCVNRGLQNPIHVVEKKTGEHVQHLAQINEYLRQSGRVYRAELVPPDTAYTEETTVYCGTSGVHSNVRRGFGFEYNPYNSYLATDHIKGIRKLKGQKRNQGYRVSYTFGNKTFGRRFLFHANYDRFNFDVYAPYFDIQLMKTSRLLGMFLFTTLRYEVNFGNSDLDFRPPMADVTYCDLPMNYVDSVYGQIALYQNKLLDVKMNCHLTTKLSRIEQICAENGWEMYEWKSKLSYPTALRHPESSSVKLLDVAPRPSFYVKRYYDYQLKFADNMPTLLVAKYVVVDGISDLKSKFKTCSKKCLNCRLVLEEFLKNKVKKKTILNLISKSCNGLPVNSKIVKSYERISGDQYWNIAEVGGSIMANVYIPGNGDVRFDYLEGKVPNAPYSWVKNVSLINHKYLDYEIRNISLVKYVHAMTGGVINFYTWVQTGSVSYGIVKDYLGADVEIEFDDDLLIGVG